MSADVVVRTVVAADFSALAVLRWRWAMGEEPAAPEVLREFRSALVEWMTDQGDACICKIAVLEGELVGMAWLAVFDRVPNPGDLQRRSGDVQSVFVVPEYRGLGIGRQLLQAICETADNLGIRSVTVHSSEQAIPLYQLVGFTQSHLLLQRERAHQE
jgi:GNAT superfamily N-acetyltransferase